MYSLKYAQSEYVKAERQYLFASKTITKTSVIILALYLPASLIYLFFSPFSAPGIVAATIAVFAAIAGCTLYFYIPAYKFKKTAGEQRFLFSNSGAANVHAYTEKSI